MIRIINGDCLQELPKLAANGERFHAAITDPPYHLTSIVKRFGGKNAAPAKHGTDGAFARASRGFMGQTWDGGDVAANPETWRAVYDCLLPGAHLVAFGGTRTYHRMACAIEDAGFEIRDTLMWLYGSGFPKSHDVSKGIDKAAGAEREVIGIDAAKAAWFKSSKKGSHDGWDRPWMHGDDAEIRKAGITAPATPEAAQWAGWGTALKPAVEPIILARKPLIGTVVATVLKHGTGALNIDASRIDGRERTEYGLSTATRSRGAVYGQPTASADFDASLGRWPANLLHDGSDEVLEAFAAFGESGEVARTLNRNGDRKMEGWGLNAKTTGVVHGDSGTAARFFFCAKPDANDRAGSKHPTVKPTELMRWLVRLITPPGGTVLDPFAGSGSTLLAADQLGFSATGIEMDPTFAADARRKVASDAGMFAEIV